MTTRKADIYRAHGIEYRNGHIFAPEFGWIRPLLVNGNLKLGRGVWTFSTLPGTKDFTFQVAGKEYTEKGTCCCDCSGCYAKTGNYCFGSVIRALGIRTFLARHCLDWLQRAIIAQIKADNITICRIHAAGDFVSPEYTNTWHNIAAACQECVFWSYTKISAAENAFSDLSNINIVKSCIPGKGFNFGHCDYILACYKALKAAGNNVYICRCGIDKNQHCTNCHACSKNEFVLFIEHGTGYHAETDPAFQELKEIIENQPRP